MGSLSFSGPGFTCMSTQKCSRNFPWSHSVVSFVSFSEDGQYCFVWELNVPNWVGVHIFPWKLSGVIGVALGKQLLKNLAYTEHPIKVAVSQMWLGEM